ncbi:MAG: VWA domain-containing protein [Candidatus Gracilibacteria bacterium]|nr:VWA domain-containing protein [Candidatus Gracilibacteria bacterium]
MNIFLFGIIFLVCLYLFALIFYKNYKYKNLYNFTKSLNYNPKNYQIFAFVFLFLSVLTLLIATFFTDYKNDKTNRSNEVVFLLDVSKSMKASDYTDGVKSISRLDTAKNFIKNFINYYPDSSYGLSVFAGETVGIAPIMSDVDTFLTFLSGVDENNVGKQGTDLSSAISYGIQRFGKNDNNTKKTLVLLSDGGDELDKNITDDILKNIKKQNIDFYIIGVGSEKGAYIPEKTDVTGEIIYKTYDGKKVLTSLNAKNLKSIASKLNGKYEILKNYSDFNYSLFSSSSNSLGNLSITKNKYLIFIAFLYFILFIGLSFLPKILGKK